MKLEEDKIEEERLNLPLAELNKLSIEDLGSVICSNDLSAYEINIITIFMQYKNLRTRYIELVTL